MPVSINWSSIESNIYSALERGMDATIHQMEARARELAPIRKVFKGQKDITIGKAIPNWEDRFRVRGSGESMLPTAGGAYRIRRRAAPVLSEEEQISMLERKSGLTAPGQNRVKVTSTDRLLASRVVTSRGRMEGVRVAKFIPAQKGQTHGTWIGRSQPFGQMGLLSPASTARLNVRGRYELMNGRAFHGVPGEATLGGRLRESIEAGEQILPQGGQWHMYLNAGSDEVYYAIYQELGTSHHPAHPFLRPALDEASKYYVKYLMRSLAAAPIFSSVEVK